MAGREGGLGARSRGLRLLSSPQAQDGGLDSGLGTCSPTSEDRGIASSLGVAEGVDWLDAVVESIYGNRKEHYMLIRGIADYKDGSRRKEWVQGKETEVAQSQVSPLQLQSSQSGGQLRKEWPHMPAEPTSDMLSVLDTKLLYK